MRAALKAAALKKRAAIEYATTEANTIATGFSQRRVVFDRDRWRRRDCASRYRARRRGRRHDLRGQPFARRNAIGLLVAPALRGGSHGGYTARADRRIPQDCGRFVDREVCSCVREPGANGVGRITAARHADGLVADRFPDSLRDRRDCLQGDSDLSRRLPGAVLNSRLSHAESEVYPNGASGCFLVVVPPAHGPRDTRGVDNDATLGRPSHNPASVDQGAHACFVVGSRAFLGALQLVSDAVQGHEQRQHDAHTEHALSAVNTPNQFSGSGDGSLKTLRVHAGLAADVSGVKASSVLALYLPQSAGLP